MSRTLRVEGCVLASDGWIRGAVQFGDRVERFFGERASAPAPFDDVVLPGFVDLHTHLREPGGEDSETVLTGTRAAAIGILAVSGDRYQPDVLQSWQLTQPARQFVAVHHRESEIEERGVR